jgi:hypothetical protein
VRLAPGGRPSCSTGIGRQGPNRFCRRLPPTAKLWWSASNVYSPGTWLADLCTREGMPFVLGHALSMNAIQGGKAQHDPIDSPKMAVVLRGGMLPQADVYPADRRATRDLLRRRMPRMCMRAERLAPIQQTHRQYNRPDLGKQLAYQANRDGVAERFPAPAVHQRMEVDLALIHPYDRRLGDIELSLLTTATPHPAPPLSLLRPVPGSGEILRLVRRYESHAIGRFPRVQACVSSGRLVQCTQASAAMRYGTVGPKLGNASLTWACAEAAVVCLRNPPAGPTSLTPREKTPGQGKAFTRLAHQLGRAGYDLFKRPTACDRRPFLSGAWNGAGEPNASRDDPGLSLSGGRGHACSAASWHAEEHRGPVARIRWPLMGPPLRLLSRRRASRSVAVGCPSPAPGTHWRPSAVPPRLCGGRDAGTDTLLGRRGRHHRRSALPIAMVTEPQEVWGADTWGLDRQVEIPPEPVARGRRRRDQHRGKKAQTPLRGKVGLLTTGGLIRVRHGNGG